MKRWVSIGFVLACLASLLFPQADLYFSRFFYTAEQGFYLKTQPWVLFIYDGVPVLGNAMAYLFAGLFLASFLSSPARFPYRLRYPCLYLLLALLIGPGLLVNKVFKDHWGRARPFQVTEFGGKQQYTPPLYPTDQCLRNCSFVSGHAALGFFFCAFAFADPSRRRSWMAFALSTGGLIGLTRIGQGKHFFFDVVFCFFLVYFSSWLIQFLIQPYRDKIMPQPLQP
ncbi:MAG: phosphatase PAP2 family protein [Methylococcaceae bacterium]|nr:phosphatase PAP2 family protein [Methylococcaceae bacterium]